ncbi:MAG TPA: hypothetical protein VLF69_00030, partial [Candidatus Saccharimonadales bacterium]|nr:hypothetical protein [Candidatus Saccharimonadales bacterium]
MTHQKPLNTRRLLARLTASGFVLTILMSGSFFFTPGIRHAEAATADCSDVFTPLSSFVTDGVAANKTFYLQVMNATGVPWELLAAIHYRETNFSHSNPANGQGIFQFSGGVGGPYPPGAVSDTEFLRQLTYMANRIQTDYALRNSPNPASVTPRALVANEQDINLVKNTLYSYNGRATVYANQATQFGYNATTQPYEGSPYVMNRFDCARARMGIITQDFGTIDGTDTRYGTFTLFARLQSDAYWLSMTQPYAWVITSQTAYTDSDYTHALTGDPTLAPGQKAYFKVVARNIGYQTWSQSVVHLGTSAPRDRASSLSDGSWLSPQRIAMQESSVTTGNTATFAFSINTPTAPGTYVEYFNVVADGVTWLPDQDLHYAIDVVSPVSASNTQNLQLTAGQFITPSTFLMSADTQSTLRLLPNGNLTLYNDLAPAWSNSTSGAPASFVLQYDGNLVEYDSTGHPLWASGTSGSSNYLAMQRDGNLVEYDSTGH